MIRPFEPLAGVRVVYSDVDGTMLGRGGAFVLDPEGAPTIEPARALATALTAGLEIVPCSGRAMPGIARDGRLLGMPTTIGEMGAVISYRFGAEVVTNLGEYPGGDKTPMRAMDRLGAVALLRDNFPLEPHAPWAFDRDYTYLLRGRADVSEAEALLAANGFPWLRLADNGLLHGSYVGLPAGESHAYHLLPAGVSKRSAIAVDRDRRSLPREQCIAIGDSLADLEMAPEVAVVVLTADAVVANPMLGEAAADHDNVVVAPRPGCLGWADVLTSLSE